MISRPLRVLHMTPYYYPAIRYGGPARSISTLCKGLAQAGAQVTVFTTNADGDGTVPAPVGTPVELVGQPPEQVAKVVAAEVN